MYRIYGISKNDMMTSQIAPTPKTSSGKRDSTGNSMGFRINNQIFGSRVGQKTSQGNRSVSPNRIITPNEIPEKDIFAPQIPNIGGMMNYQVRNNMNMDKDFSSIIGKHKKMIKKKRTYKTGSNMFAFPKSSPTQKRVKANAIGKDPIVGIHKRFMSNKTPYNQTQLNRNANQMEGVKGFSFNPTITNINKTKEQSKPPEVNKTFTRNQSRKKYREVPSDDNISESYVKSIDSKKIKKKRKIKKIMPPSSIQNSFLGQPSDMTQTFYQKKLLPNGSGLDEINASTRPPSIDRKIFRNNEEEVDDVEN